MRPPEAMLAKSIWTLRTQRAATQRICGGTRSHTTVLIDNRPASSVSTRRPIKHFVNLSNGVEAIVPMLHAGVSDWPIDPRVPTLLGMHGH